MSEKMVIDRFQEFYRFLSNFWLAQVVYDGVAYPSSEAAYQAQKCPARIEEFVTLTPHRAKVLGSEVEKREDWGLVKEYIMREVVFGKFSQNPELAEKLIATGDAELIEGNHWGDTFWGVCDGVGQNNLGEILMETRERLVESARQDRDVIFGDLVRIGFEPSSPNSEVDSWEPWLYYDGPITGKFNSQGKTVLFWVFDIVDTPFIQCEYVILDESDAAVVDTQKFETTAEMDEYYAAAVNRHGVAGAALARSKDFVIVAVATDPELLNYDKGWNLS